jgi:hypothetical protein
MKTTLNLDDVLLAQAKIAAAQNHMTLTRLIEEGLKLRLSNRNRRHSGCPVVIPVYHGRGGLVSGFDGLSNKAMLEAAGQ